VYLLNSSFGTNFSTQPIANPQPTLQEQPIGEPMYMTIISKGNVLGKLKDWMQIKLLGQITYNPEKKTAGH